MSFSSGLGGCGGGTSAEGDCISWALPARRDEDMSNPGSWPPRVVSHLPHHLPAFRDISASLRGRSEGLTPAGEPRMSGRALRRPVLPEDAKSSTGSTSVMLTLGRHGRLPRQHRWARWHPAPGWLCCRQGAPVQGRQHPLPAAAQGAGLSPAQPPLPTLTAGSPAAKAGATLPVGLTRPQGWHLWVL